MIGSKLIYNEREQRACNRAQIWQGSGEKGEPVLRFKAAKGEEKEKACNTAERVGKGQESEGGACVENQGH